MTASNRFRQALLCLSMTLMLGCGGGGDDDEGAAPNAETVKSGKRKADSGEKATSPAHGSSTGSSPGRANRLARETSPYLLLHAHNPVDWYPWGPEAFEKAKRENKPIFLSIGYSSCYWCHVMERKVFSDEKIAKYMNEHFVCIKVDREERPDVDDIYMTGLQLIQNGQGGGWPLSMFLTPEGKPFVGGTYFPPEDSPEYGRPGFPTVMQRVTDAWSEQRDEIEAFAEERTQQLKRMMKPALVLTPVEIDRKLVADAAKALKDSYDSAYGGIDFNPGNPNRPKFPVPTKLAFLQYEARRHSDEQAAKIVFHTLDSLASGGIRDHLAGGFHRYSTDRFWHVPHFEKMLYDQAQLADVFVEAYRQTDKPLYRQAAEEIFTYVLRQMTDPDGGYYSALDAETDHIEGKYYVWSAKEISDVLGADDAKIFNKIYGLNEPNPFEHGYVLHLPKPLEEALPEASLSAEKLTEMRAKLLAVRDQRKPPLRDDKLLTSWNGLMIRAFANAGAVFDNAEYIQAAEKAALFVLANMRDEEGRLHRSYRAKQAKLNAYLDDYAFLVEAILALHRATSDDKWLNAAQRLTDQQIELFWDEKGSGFFFTSHHHEELIARTKNAYDSVLPAGNSVSVRNLLRIASLTGEDKYRQKAKAILELFAGSLERSPRAMTNMAVAMGEFLDDPDFGAARKKTSSTGRNSTGEFVVLQVAAESPKDKKQKDEIVIAKAYLSVDKLSPDRKCKIVVYVKIKKGWHINANPPKPDYLIPTRLIMKSKHGTKVSQIRYPTSKKLELPDFDEPLYVYEGTAAIRGVVEVPAPAGGKTEEMELQIRYQACNDAGCIPPKTFKLTGKLPVAKPGEAVKEINQKMFPKPVRKPRP